MEEMAKQAAHCGAEVLFDVVSAVDLEGPPFTLSLDGGDTLTCDALVIATGAQARWLGLESERRFQGAGVSACATCDGFFFKNKRVAVIGGGNSAVEEAIFLANICEHVTLIHRRDKLRAEKIGQDRLFAHPKIDVIWDSAVKEVKGVGMGEGEAPGVTGIDVENLKTGALTHLELDGMFVAIGHDPSTELFKGKITLDNEGYIITAPDSTATNVEGVYAAGDVKDKTYRQAVTAAGMGCMAALEADKFLSLHETTMVKQAEAAE